MQVLCSRNSETGKFPQLLSLNQVFNLSLGEFRRGMGPVWLPHLLPRAHIEQAFTQLLLDFVGRKVHILAVLH